jgi:hypothetical protein
MMYVYRTDWECDQASHLIRGMNTTAMVSIMGGKIKQAISTLIPMKERGLSYTGPMAFVIPHDC